MCAIQIADALDPEGKADKLNPNSYLGFHTLHLIVPVWEDQKSREQTIRGILVRLHPRTLFFFSMAGCCRGHAAILPLAFLGAFFLLFHETAVSRLSLLRRSGPSSGGELAN